MSESNVSSVIIKLLSVTGFCMLIIFGMALVKGVIVLETDVDQRWAVMCIGLMLWISVIPLVRKLSKRVRHDF